MSRWLRGRIVADRVVAAVLAVLTAPLVAVCAWRVKAHDGGPAFVRVPRMGQHVRTFPMWKIRTMRVDGDDGLASGARLTGAGDTRITAVGETLRSFHLDELPQLWNVVAGEMSLLGPRPEDPAYVDPDDPRWELVLAMPPGMAGITQLVVGDWEQQVIAADPGGYQRDVVPAKRAIDGWYVRGATPKVDLAAVVALLQHLVTHKSDCGLAERICREVPEAGQVGAGRA